MYGHVYGVRWDNAQRPGTNLKRRISPWSAKYFRQIGGEFRAHHSTFICIISIMNTELFLPSNLSFIHLSSPSPARYSQGLDF